MGEKIRADEAISIRAPLHNIPQMLIAHQGEYSLSDREVMLLLHILSLEEQGIQTTYEAISKDWQKSSSQVREIAQKLCKDGILVSARMEQLVITISDDFLQRLLLLPLPRSTKELTPVPDYDVDGFVATPVSIGYPTLRSSKIPCKIFKSACVLDTENAASKRPVIVNKTLEQPKSIKNVLLTASAVAEMLSISQQQVYNLAKQERLPSIRVGRSIRFSSEALYKWVADQTQ